MAEFAWPALLAALSFFIGTNLSDSLFSEVLTALQDFTVACGLLGLKTPRDAFLSTLAKYAVSPPVVSAMQSYMEAPNPSRSNSVIGAEALGLTALGVGAPTGPPSLSERNLACLKSTINTARILSGSLGDAWHDVLETLQNANFLLAAKRPTPPRRPTIASPTVTSPSPAKSQATDPTDDRGEIFNDLDADSIQSAINVLFDGTKELDNPAFTTFVVALCRLSSEMIGVESFGSAEMAPPPSPSPMSPSMTLSSIEAGSRRRTSGLNISNSIKSGDRSFSLTKLRVVATLNLSRLVSCDPGVGWNVITQHLLAVARHATALSAIRMQASDTLGELLLSAVRIGKESRIQRQVFDVLVRQVDSRPVSTILSTDYDVRSSGYQALNQILESSGHSLEVGWQTIFGMLDSVCRDSPAMTRTDSSSSLAGSRPSTFANRGNAALIRIAFPSLTLICTDFLSSLDSQAMRHCISCLGCFGRQKNDVNITLAAIGLLWNVSDAVQGSDKELWLYLLTELLELGQDSRLEARRSAMQTLFRCLELYGSTLSPQRWDDVLWNIVFPLLDNTTGDESQVLALSSVGHVFNTFLGPISALPTFEKVVVRLLGRFRKSFIAEPRPCCTAALKALEQILTAVDASVKSHLGSMDPFLSATWTAFIEMGNSIPTGEPYTQENLVAFVRIASILHTQLTWTSEMLKQLSTILRNTMTYTKSPDYQPDTDVMSPLQACVTDLIATSTKLGASIVLSDLAEFASLAYFGEKDTRLSFVAVSKFSLPMMGQVFERCSSEVALYEDGTVESIIAAYSIPIKLKYDCPAPSKYGNDLPLWKTVGLPLFSADDSADFDQAMGAFLPVLEKLMLSMDTICTLSDDA